MPFIFSIFYVIQLGIIKFEAAEALEYKKLQKITIAKKDIQWIVAKKELIINGKLFDVKSFKDVGVDIEIKGLFDEDEDSLQQQANNLLQQKEQPGGFTNNSSIAFLIFQPVFSENNIVINDHALMLFFKKNNHCFTEGTASATLDITIPPPKADSFFS